MPEYPINFTAQDNTLAFQIYQALLAQGVSPQEMDQGWRETNYAGIHCPDTADTFCTQGTPGVVEANDVLEYAFNHDQKYQELLVRTLGEPLPWSLDDLDPTTAFDEQIRARVQEAIDVLRGILKEAGIEEGSEDYKERMAVGMYYLASLPSAQEIRMARQSFLIPLPNRNLVGMQELTDLGLGKFKDYLSTCGGFRVFGHGGEEFSALDAIKNKGGECTEQSKILFAILRMAGLDPVFVRVDQNNLSSNDPYTQKLITETPANMDHICIGVYIRNLFRLLDASLINSNPNYVKYAPEALRQYLSSDYSNRGLAWTEKNELDKAFSNYTRALETDPENAEAYYNRGNAWAQKGEWDKALVDYTRALEINPEMEHVYCNRGLALAKKGDLDEAIADYTRAIEISPEDAEVYNNRGAAYYAKSDWDNAIADYTRAIEINPRYAAAYLNRGVTLVFKDNLAVVIKDIANCLMISPNLSEQSLKMLANFMNKSWQQDSTKKEITDQFRTDMNGYEIAEVQAFLIHSYALWEAGFQSKSKEEFTVFSTLIDNCQTKRKLSPTTKAFFTDMFQLMPQTMQQDEQVQEMVGVIRTKIK